ncbi:DUF4235 domain-containing protein [Angustibacter sp. McL0619]|uniref:DUF4235 domain-containing protein n=1 Tax=Angustibacter sp. McL0619 TaxID=3415676 RepID=UPI003CEE56F1
MGAVGWKVIGGGAAVLSGIAAKMILTNGWKVATGNEPPANPENPDTSWSEAVSWAVVSGALVGVVRMLAARKAASYYRHSTGHLPPKMEEVS